MSSGMKMRGASSGSFNSDSPMTPQTETLQIGGMSLRSVPHLAAYWLIWVKAKQLRTAATLSPRLREQHKSYHSSILHLNCPKRDQQKKLVH
mmetsp:Transcript_18142/g.28108  ORF Transcript_18142/g.28108 Transcript_18142/m.28108 type:complete len:92 (+) Transcript_18142:826-1101(+)